MATLTDLLKKSTGVKIPPKTTPIATALKVVQAQPKQIIVPARTTPIAQTLKVVGAGGQKATTPSGQAPKESTFRSVVSAPNRFLLKKVLPSVGERIQSIGESYNTRSLDPLKKSLQKQSDEMSIGKATSFEDKVRRASNIALMANLDAGLKFKKSAPKIEVSQPHNSTGTQPENIQNSVDKLLNALTEVEPIRKTQDALYAAERSKRLAKVMAVRGKVGGEKGLYAELGQLKGELPKAQFESLRNKVGQEDIDNLFNAVTQSNRLGEFEKITARQGLAKVFGATGGVVPTTGELKLLKQVFPEEVVTSLLSKRPVLSKVGEGVINTLNIPRSIMSSFDLSAPLRQGLYMVGRPKQFFPAFASMFKQFGDEAAFKVVQEGIQARPTYKVMRESKLALTDMNSVLDSREEQFMSNFAEKIPIVGRFIRASGRAYTGFLNKLRADVFDDLLKKSTDLGVEQTPKMTQDLAEFINTTTGRGKLPGKTLESAASALNAVFFSPRLMASRIQMLNPHYYVKLDPFVRKEAIKTMLSSGAAILTTLGLAKMGGAKVETDPRNADFAKIKIGNTRFDVMGGLQQYLRLAAQLASGQIISSITGKTLTLGEGYKPLTRLDIAERFFLNKENPVASFVTSWLQGQNSIGEPFDLSDELLARVVPMMEQSIEEAIKEWGPIQGLAMSVPGVFGVGTQTYKPTDEQAAKMEEEEEKGRMQVIYEKVQDLKNQGKIDEAQSIVDGLSDIDYDQYKTYKTAQKRNQTIQNKENVEPIFEKVQQLLKEGKQEEAQSIVDSLTDEQYKAYKLLKNK
jgi:hypothetical protein